jgi:hypothetical protein
MRRFRPESYGSGAAARQRLHQPSETICCRWIKRGVHALDIEPGMETWIAPAQAGQLFAN